MFEDEGRFGRISDTRRCWVPLPKRPIVGHQVIRQYIYSIAAVSPADRQIVSLIMSWVDTETMSIFLAHAKASFPNDECLMVLDRAAWHKANALRIPQSLHLIFLPPYSPELNPTEHVWDHIRENFFGNHVFPSLDAVESRLCEAFRSLTDNPEIVRSMTSFDWFNTPCMT
ncbi:MAG: IS630 family transposase [Candidatus Magnetominusculus sp. LBB02]|nr:IS630 family transposase [Candidatus Magnetominusculus sp. LBB02]